MSTTAFVKHRVKSPSLLPIRTKVCDIVQEAVIKTIPKKNKCKKAKWLSEEALQIAVKRREAKRKGEKERYTHLNAEFQGKIYPFECRVSKNNKER